MTYSTHIPQQKDAAAVGVFFCVHIDKKHRKEEKKIMSKTTFSYVAPIKKDLHDTEVDIYANGVNVGCITRNRPGYCALADTFSVCGFGTQNDDYYRSGNCIRRNVTTIAGAKMAFKKWFESQCWEDIKAAAPKDNLRHISEPEALTSYVCGQAFHMVDWRREGIDVLNPICADPSELVLHTCLRRFAGDYKNERKVSLHHTAYRGEDYLDYVIEEESLRSEMQKKDIVLYTTIFAISKPLRSIRSSCSHSQRKRPLTPTSHDGWQKHPPCCQCPRVVVSLLLLFLQI